ncbi:histidinol-phosphate aminotransferase [Virgibacillus subterraneus]|uniref:Histidinol-phosphate aminotransferase n=1 Tax=Virgibacillus subterraneus TaxID=621109 RepID=A0A1H9EJN5_9BACI|nr:histidinol-phosphate transaminase [Virgibacillus subterraneus]SEQ25869.1 histidinol-phosphate aminotransferase [Virgibacillus subterraneus]
MNGKRILKEMTPYKQGKQMHEVKKEFGLERIVKLASNENPFGYTKKINEYFDAQLPSFDIYPDGYTSELRTAVANKLNINEDQLVFGSGTDEIVQMVGRAFLYPGVNTVMPTPTFPQYKHNAIIEGATVKEIPTINGYHDLDGMLYAIDEDTNVVWLCSPNNPTGSIIAHDDFYTFMEKCPKHVLVVLDEAYYEYVQNNMKSNISVRLSSYKNLLILRTFSKAYGLAGLRIGYGVANKELIANLDVVRGPFNTSSMAQKAALIALDDDEFLLDSTSRNSSIKHSFQQFLDSIGWHYYDSQTNFLLISTPINGDEVFQYLLENGFIVRSGEGLGCPNTIRVTIGNEDDMKQLQDIVYQLHLDINKERES